MWCRIGILKPDPMQLDTQRGLSAARWLLATTVVFGLAWIVTGQGYPKFVTTVATAGAVACLLWAITSHFDSKIKLRESLEKKGFVKVRLLADDRFTAWYIIKGRKVDGQLVRNNDGSTTVWVRLDP